MASRSSSQTPENSCQIVKLRGKLKHSRLMEKFSSSAQPDSHQTLQPSSVVTPFDRTMMQRCIELARRALGRTAPNPLVGSVIVQNGQIVGEGFHPGAGHPHAEVFALREAGGRAKKTTT